jgi:hypothetical protein
MNKEEWCIVRYVCQNEPRRGEVDILIRKRYQWEATGKYYQHKWEYLATGFNSNEDALQWVSLFKE